MILTITMNPSVDIAYPLEHVKLNEVNRVSQVTKTAGGKGLNVSRVLQLLGKELTATGVLGGHLGEYIKETLSKEGIPHDFVSIQEESRNAIAVLHDRGLQTEILEAGPMVTKKEEARFLTHYQQLLPSSTLVTISGSLAAGLSPALYETLISLAKFAEVPVLLDTSGPALKAAVFSDNQPFLIKPNEAEIAELLSINQLEHGTLIEQLKYPELEGIEWIVVSMGANGALAKHKNHFYRVTIPEITVVNPVGSGDATLAGLAAAIAENSSDEEVLKLGMATGMLNALEMKTGWIAPERIPALLNKIQVEKLS